MCPGYTAARLFEPCTGEEPTDAGLLDVIEDRINRPTFGVVEWGPEWPGKASRADPGPPAGGAGGIGEEARQLGRRLLRLKQARRFSDREIGQFAHLAGNVIDLDTRTDIQISGDGSAHLTCRYETLNMTDRPLTRMSRALWFEYTDGKLDIRPLRESTRRVAIQRVHDTPTLSRFACQLSPAIQPGESAVVGYTCDGGKFVDALYWRRAMYRYTRRFTVSLRHGNAGDLLGCSAVEEHPDGSENSATEDLTWDCEGDDVIITLTREEYLRPNQSVTLRWEVAREHA